MQMNIILISRTFLMPRIVSMNLLTKKMGGSAPNIDGIDD